MTTKPSYEELERRIEELEKADNVRNKIEKELQESEEKFRLAFHTSPDSINLNRLKDGVYIDINDGFTKLMGYTRQDVVGKSSLALNIWANPEDRQLLVAGLKEHGIVENLEAEFTDKNGQNKTALMSARILRITDEDLILSITRDITERKQAEGKLRQAQAILQAAMDCSPAGIAIADAPDGRLRYVNDAGLLIRGGDRQSVVNGVGVEQYAAIWKLLDLDGRPLRTDEVPLARAIMFGETNSRDFIIRRKEGEDRIVTANAAPIKDETEKITAGIVVFLDITERKQAEAEREKLQAQLLQAQKMESVGRLAGGVAHDFNNMLGVILGHTELALLKADEDNDLISDLKEIQKAANRSADTTKQLLAFARKETISPRQLDLNDTLESMLNMLRRLIGEDIDLVWQPATHLWPVKMDPSQIDQILANLCVNARDAFDGVGKLTIETGRKTFDEAYCKELAGFIPGDFVLLAVSDNGCGMDKDTLDNLFEPFFTTKGVGKGTGLGLATVYGIVKQNNGFINVYSELGQGSTFKIYLPRLVTDENTEKDMPEKKAAAGGTETILLVEDEASILRMTRLMLERNGYAVISAATPVEAIEKAKNHSGSINLLMTDVVMPEMNGRDLAGQISSLYPGIRLLFMSGYTANVIAHQGILDDGVAFIQKPFSMVDMTEKVREVLDMASDKS